MSDTVMLELSPEARAAIQQLMSVYGEKSPREMVSRALGFMQVIERYLDHGTLRIVDPKNEDDVVEFYFENVADLPDYGRSASYAA